MRASYAFVLQKNNAEVSTYSVLTPTFIIEPKVEYFAPSGYLRTHVVYTRIATARLGIQHQGILQFQSFNPKKGFNTDSHDIFTDYGPKSRRVPDGNTAKFFVRAIGF